MKTVKNIQSLLKKVQSPPEPSEYLQKLTSLMDQSDFKNRDLHPLLSETNAFNKKIVSLLNSPFFSFEDMIKNSYQGFLYLGPFDFYQIVILAEIFQIFDDRLVGSDHFDTKGFWRHSFACGIACKEIAKHMLYPNIQEAFTAGILHDIGKLCWKKYFPHYLKGIMTWVREEDILMFDAEKQFLNITHCDLGFWFLQTLGIRSTWNNVVRHHHNPEASMEREPLVAIVHVADILVRALCVGNPGDDKIPTLNRHAFERCQLTAGYLEFLLDRIYSEVSAVDLFIEKIF